MPGLLFLSVTGLSVTLGWTTAPSISPQGGGHAAHAGAGGHRAATADVGVDRIAQAAADKGLSGPLEIVWPGDPGAPTSSGRSTRPRPPGWTRSPSTPPPAR
nr:hypothetical protein [Planomonospora parontospora]